MSQLGGYRYWVDPELKMVHLFQDCVNLKVARKYQYVQTVHVDTVAQARLLDERGRACHLCFKREVHLARRDNRTPRPGFKKAPGK